MTMLVCHAQKKDTTCDPMKVGKLGVRTDLTYNQPNVAHGHDSLRIPFHSCRLMGLMTIPSNPKPHLSQKRPPQMAWFKSPYPQ